VTEAREIVATLGMQPHAEGGWYVQTWLGAGDGSGSRPPGSAILYLLATGERSHWHRLDAAEVWQYSAGEALELRVWLPGEPAVATYRLGPEVGSGDAVQAVVPVGAWQSARPLGSWTLVGCVVAPAFDFAGFELAPDGWEPPI
jgi:predicted cupin superfamily sugar epimerase